MDLGPLPPHATSPIAASSQINMGAFLCSGIYHVDGYRMVYCQTQYGCVQKRRQIWKFRNGLVRITTPGQAHAASLRLTTHHQPVNQGDQRSCQQDQGPAQVHPGDQGQANSGA
jgi:hypothetical protein